MSIYHYNTALLFEHIAAEHASRPALRFLDNTTATYADLNRVANQIARVFLAAGLQPGQVICLFNEKTLHSYACMLAALKLGMPYANLDTSSPQARLEKILARCAPRAILHGAQSAGLVRQIEPACAVMEYTARSWQAEVRQQPADNLPATRKVTGKTPAYIMFTSGSTGFPKGAVMSHANLLNFIQWSQETLATRPDDVFTNVNPMHFDNSVFDFYSSLFTGASMVPVPEDLAKTPRQMLEALNRTGCTVWFSVPSMLVYMLRLRALRETDLPDVRTIVFGGEGFPKAQLRKLHALLGQRTQLLNVYGPTECTCICSSYPVAAADMEKPELLPLGPIAPNFSYLILDDKGGAAPVGETGELCLLGPNVGLGYYNDPERTAQAFVQNPGVNAYAEIMYRTGDLVRQDPKTRLLHFAGRADNQVKRMGFRIELEEIEVAAGSIEGVNECGAVFDARQEIGRIILFAGSASLDGANIEERLRGLVPPYMIPDEIRVMGELPKNRNGKVDRKELKRLWEAENA